jgi:hypothetical protein
MFDKTTHRLVIWDIKTSTRGWTKWDKQNKIKTSQMVIYKKFEPSSGKTTINKTVQNIREFIEDVFIKGTHSYNTDKEYTKTATVKACRWCPFLDTEHCDAGVKK